MRPPCAARASALFLAAISVLTACGDDGSSGSAVTSAPSASTASTPGATTSGAPATTPTTTSIERPPAPTSFECAGADDAPPLVVANGTSVGLLEPGTEVRELATFEDEVWLAFGNEDGLVVASTRVGTGPGSKSQGWIVEDGVAREIVEEGSPGVLVYELTRVDGAPVVIYGPLRDTETQGAPETTPIVAARVDGTDRWGLGRAFGPEWGVTSASAADGFVVFSAVADLTETVFTTTERDPLELDDRFAPKAEYGAPPLVTSAVLSPDAARLAWIEGPDWDNAAQASNDDPWQLVIADARTGDERFRRSILGPAEAVLHVEWDGDTAFISRFDAPPLIVDTVDDDAPMVEACGVEGVVTLPRPRG